MLFVRLDVNFQDDDKLLEVTPAAELVFIRGLAMAKRLGTDGYLSRSHLRRISDKLETPPEQLAQQLVDVGLWEPFEHGWLVLSWLKHNQPMDELTEAKSAGGKLGAHRRWGHLGDVDDCVRCHPDGTPNGTTQWVPNGSEMHRDRDRVETDKTHNPPVSPPSPKPGKRALPDDWEPNPTHTQIAAELGRDLTREADDFRDYCLSNDRRYKDHDAAFRKWLRNDRYRPPATGNGAIKLTATEQRRLRNLQSIEQHTGGRP